MAIHAVTVRLDHEDRERLDSEAERLGVRPGTLARILLRSALRPAQRDLLAPTAGAAGALPIADPSVRRRIVETAERHGARDVRMFGSAARGESGPGSDLDLLVRMDEGRSLVDLIALSGELEALLGRGVDVVTDGGVNPHLRERIHREAVPL